MTGKGAGLSDQGLLHKMEVIQKAISLHKPDPADELMFYLKLADSTLPV